MVSPTHPLPQGPVPSLPLSPTLSTWPLASFCRDILVGHMRKAAGIKRFQLDIRKNFTTVLDVHPKCGPIGCLGMRVIRSGMAASYSPEIHLAPSHLSCLLPSTKCHPDWNKR